MTNYHWLGKPKRKYEENYMILWDSLVLFLMQKKPTQMSRNSYAQVTQPLVGVFGKRHWANSHAFDKTKWKFEKDLNLVPSDYCLWCRTNCHNVIYLSLKRSSCQNTFVFFNYICSGRVGYIWVDFAPEIDILFTSQNFKHIMKELQGAIIISSAFQAFIGYSGLMTLILRYEYLQSKMDLVFAPRC